MALRGVELWLVDRLLVPASLHDVNGTFVHVNAAAEQASGFSRAALVGRHYTDLLVPETRGRVEAHFRRAVEHGEPTDFETVFVDGRGQIRAVRAQHLPLREAETVVGVLILAFDTLAPARPVVRDPEPQLTPRQIEVLRLIASGLSTAETAERLTLSIETVRNHLRSVFRELHVHNRLEAIATARRLGLLAPPVFGSQRSQ